MAVERSDFQDTDEQSGTDHKKGITRRQFLKAALVAGATAVGVAKLAETVPSVMEDQATKKAAEEKAAEAELQSRHITIAELLRNPEKYLGKEIYVKGKIKPDSIEDLHDFIIKQAFELESETGETVRVNSFGSISELKGKKIEVVGIADMAEDGVPFIETNGWYDDRGMYNGTITEIAQ